MISTHCCQVECVPNLLSVRIILVADVGVVEAGVEGVFRREFSLVEPIH